MVARAALTRGAAPAESEGLRRDELNFAKNDILPVGQTLKVKWIEASLASAEVSEREGAGTRKDRSDEKEMRG